MIKKYKEFVGNSVVPVNAYFDTEHDVKRFELLTSQSHYGYVIIQVQVLKTNGPWA